MKKKSGSLVLIMIITLIVLITMLIGILCSYFINVTKNIDNNIKVKVTNVMVFYSNSDQIKISEFKNDTEKTLMLDVINYGDVSVKYELNLNIIDPLTEDKNSGLTYYLESLTDGSDELISSETTEIPTESKLLGSTKISPKSTHKYILHIKVIDEKLFDRDVFTCGLTVNKGIN